MIDVFLLHAGVIALALLVAYVLHLRNLRMKASFNLYRIRDKFVLLVATGVLPEDSRVFKHYYGRINNLLQEAPNVGLDNMLDTIFNKVRPGEFDRAVEKARDQAKKMHEDPLLQNVEVRAAVADYYSAISAMILAHSSMLRLVYILSKRFAHSFLSDYLSGRFRRGLKAVDYANAEAKLYKPNSSDSNGFAHC